MFDLISKFTPTGDQPQAIEKLTQGLKDGRKFQTLLGVTGSGKTFTIANVIKNIGRPTIVISHNKTLAAQLYQEFKEFFPNNSVHYFVSFYDYYQPEAYIPRSDTYIEKDSRINEEIDRLRHAATQGLMSRDDVIIVASVSCIYNLGSPDEYKKSSLNIFEGQEISTQDFMRSLVRLHYNNDIELTRGSFRKTKDEIEIVSSTGDQIIKIKLSRNPVKRKTKIAKIWIAKDIEIDDVIYKKPIYEKVIDADIYPAKFWIASHDKMDLAMENIRTELQKHMKVLQKQDKVDEAFRLREKTELDLEMIKQTGYCHGIENYSRHLDFRKAGEPPYTLLDFFKTKKDFLTIIDESHISIPQLRGMYAGDHSRKSTLIKHGFRLPSAIDNRPLMFKEIEKSLGQTIFISATPRPHELEKSKKIGTAEQLVRPTGLLDPTVEIKPTKDQIPHLIKEIRKRVDKNQRVLVTTLTKRMAEDLSEHIAEKGIKVNYIHSEVKTLDRVQILNDLRKGVYEVIVGVNLLREGLDLPEVSLIAILDADKEGFLRNATTLIQTMGRAARNVDGHIIMYADKTTKSMQTAISETLRRRKIQEKYNKENNITPKTIKKSIADLSLSLYKKKKEVVLPLKPEKQLESLQRDMELAIKKMQFEKALYLREQLNRIKQNLSN